MMQQPTDRRRWTSREIAGAAAWYHPIGATAIALVSEASWEETNSGSTIALPAPSPQVVSALRAELHPALEELEKGRGFVILRGLPPAWTSCQKQLAYWLLGHGLGKPVVQNVQGVVLYD